MPKKQTKKSVNEMPVNPRLVKSISRPIDQSDRDRAREVYALTANLAEVARTIGYPYGVVNHAYRRDKGTLSDWDEFGVFYRQQHAKKIQAKYEGRVAACLEKALTSIQKRLDKGDIGNPTSVIGELQKLYQTYRLHTGQSTDNLKVDWSAVAADFAGRSDEERAAIIATLRQGIKVSAN